MRRATIVGAQRNEPSPTPCYLNFMRLSKPSLAGPAPCGNSTLLLGGACCYLQSRWVPGIYVFWWLSMCNCASGGVPEKVPLLCPVSNTVIAPDSFITVLFPFPFFHNTLKVLSASPTLVLWFGSKVVGSCAGGSRSAIRLTHVLFFSTFSITIAPWLGTNGGLFKTWETTHGYLYKEHASVGMGWASSLWLLGFHRFVSPNGGLIMDHARTYSFAAVSEHSLGHKLASDYLIPEP